MGAPRKKKEFIVTMKCVDCGKERDIRPERPGEVYWPLCKCGGDMRAKRMARR